MRSDTSLLLAILAVALAVAAAEGAILAARWSGRTKARLRGMDRLVVDAAQEVRRTTGETREYFASVARAADVTRERVRWLDQHAAAMTATVTRVHGMVGRQRGQRLARAARYVRWGMAAARVATIWR